MISALELKTKIEDLDKKTSLLKFIIRFGVIPALIAFPITYVLNPNIDPVVRNSPLLLGFGFFAFIAMFLTFAIGGLVMIHLAISSYLAYRRFNATSILVDDFVPRELAKRIDVHIFERLRTKFEPIFDEIKAGLRHEISESKKEVIKELKTEIQTIKDQALEREKQDMFVIQQQWKIIVKKDVEIDVLKKRVDVLEKKESEREQKISKKAHVNNNIENTKSLDDSNKIEFLDE